MSRLRVAYNDAGMGWGSSLGGMVPVSCLSSSVPTCEAFLVLCIIS